MIKKSRFGRWRALAAVPVLVLGLTVLSSAPAAASIGTLHIDLDREANDDGNTTESSTAECNTGETLIGAGWVAGGAIVDEVVPDVTTGTVRVEAWEPEGGSVRANWQVDAHAICATSVSNVEVVHDVGSLYNSTDVSKSDTATCPFPKKVVGLGYEIGTFAGGEVHVTSIVPAADRVTVSASEDGTGTTASWSVMAYAVCATEPSGLQLVPTAAATTPANTTLCPGAKKAIGVGASVNTASRDVDIYYAKPSSYSGYELGMAGADDDRNGTTLNWAVSTTLICVNP